MFFEYTDAEADKTSVLIGQITNSTLGVSGWFCFNAIQNSRCMILPLIALQRPALPQKLLLLTCRQ